MHDDLVAMTQVERARLSDAEAGGEVERELAELDASIRCAEGACECGADSCRLDADLDLDLDD